MGGGSSTADIATANIATANIENEHAIEEIQRILQSSALYDACVGGPGHRGGEGGGGGGGGGECSRGCGSGGDVACS